VIETSRLLLIPATPEMLSAELTNHGALAAALDATVPDTWPPEYYDGDAVSAALAALAGATEDRDWHLHYFAHKPAEQSSATLIGAGGYKGPPAEDGTVEIGYSIVRDAQRRGFASEAVRGLLNRAFVDGRVDRVIAHTLPQLVASIGVLQKCGFRDVGPGEEVGTICYALRREEFIAD
jgi:[ribosomal protein S5]-alanine N-acetyltransferase